MTLAMVERWSASEKGEPMLTLPGAQPREVQLEGYRRYAALSDRWLGRFLDQRLLSVDPSAKAIPDEADPLAVPTSLRSSGKNCS
jgi:hypothetical protein